MSERSGVSQEPDYAPLISVIIPAYNAERTLSETANSLRTQTYPHWEGIIVNDGSTDKTSVIAHKWARSDPRFRVIDQGNMGLGGARNTAIASAKGELIHCLDADDLIAPSFYKKVIQTLSQPTNRSAPGKCAVCNFYLFLGSAYIYANYVSAKYKGFDLTSLTQGNFGPPVVYVFERSILELTGVFDSELKHCQDWDLWLRFSRINVDFTPIPDAWAFYRTSQKSLSRRYDSYIEAANILLNRVATIDERCLTSYAQAALVSPTEINRSIINFWGHNLRRATSSGIKADVAKLFKWAKSNLPDDFWTTPDKYGFYFRFQWAETGPLPDRTLETEIDRRLFHLAMLCRHWPTTLSVQMLESQIRDIQATIQQSHSSLPISTRIRQLFYLFQLPVLSNIGVRNYFRLFGLILFPQPLSKVVKWLQAFKFNRKE